MIAAKINKLFICDSPDLAAKRGVILWIGGEKLVAIKYRERLIGKWAHYGPEGLNQKRKMAYVYRAGGVKRLEV